jgi:hypothetical protein
MYTTLTFGSKQFNIRSLDENIDSILFIFLVEFHKSTKVMIENIYKD